METIRSKQRCYHLLPGFTPYWSCW